MVCRARPQQLAQPGYPRTPKPVPLQTVDTVWPPMYCHRPGPEVLPEPSLCPALLTSPSSPAAQSGCTVHGKHFPTLFPCDSFRPGTWRDPGSMPALSSWRSQGAGTPAAGLGVRCVSFAGPCWPRGPSGGGLQPQARRCTLNRAGSHMTSWMACATLFLSLPYYVLFINRKQKTLLQVNIPIGQVWEPRFARDARFCVRMLSFSLSYSMLQPMGGSGVWAPAPTGDAWWSSWLLPGPSGSEPADGGPPGLRLVLVTGIPG